MKAIFKFVSGNFKRMPRWVQVSVYLLFVGVVVFEFIKPRVITTRVVMKDTGGGEDHYRGQQIMVNFVGHILKFRTNEDGLVVIPAHLTSINIRINLAPFLDLKDQES